MRTPGRMAPCPPPPKAPPPSPAPAPGLTPARPNGPLRLATMSFGLPAVAGIAIAHLIDLNPCARGIGLVETRDPGCRRLQQRWLAGDHHDGVEPGDRLELHQALTQAALAGIHDALKLADHRLGH